MVGSVFESVVGFVVGIEVGSELESETGFPINVVTAIIATSRIMNAMSILIMPAYLSQNIT